MAQVKQFDPKKQQNNQNMAGGQPPQEVSQQTMSAGQTHAMTAGSAPMTDVQQQSAPGQIPGGQSLPTDIESRRQQELEMLQQTAQLKEMMAKSEPKIGEREIRKASEILQKYKEGKQMLESKIIANEQFWKLRQWNYMNDGKDDFKPATAWLWSCIQSRYSDAMDSYPTCNFQPRQKDDVVEATKLTSIVPVIMEQNRYEDVYSDIVWYTLKHGGSVQGIFWDSTKHNGLGDISIKKIDFINLFWEPGITDIQKSQNLFNTELVDNEVLEQRYPQCAGKLTGRPITLAKYLYDDSVNTTDKSVVVDWYYHTEYNGKKVLQYVKYVNNVVLYATENMISRPEQIIVDQETKIPMTIATGQSMAERGLYDHALYPFVTMALYPVEGSICGYGLTDIGRDTQLQIDKLNKAITDNAIIGATPRYFIKNDGSVNEEEYADVSNDFIHVEGSLGEENIRPVDTKALDDLYVSFLNNKIEELKYVTSNQDSNNGVAPSGVTAASAIAALQETAGKNARSSNKTFHRAFREVCYQVVELIRQFYDVPRTFRISPDTMAGEQFIEYDNSGLSGQQQQTMGMDMGLRVPEFDIEVTSEKANPYKKMEINELALSFYNAGFFNPQMVDQAMGCLQMMDFNKKNDIMQRIAKNGTLQEMLIKYQQLALQLAQKYEPAAADSIANMILKQGGQVPPKSIGLQADTKSGNASQEHPYVEKSREQSRESTQAD
ncbi:MAG: hypothetical protein PHP50_09645 [Lachnospiraceae bacterium]|nr:hypothetical protein [Lachnospiraceae bacterium]